MGACTQAARNTRAGARTGGVCRKFVHRLGTWDHCKIMRKERRRRRAESSVTLALTYQLDDCCRDGGIAAMVVADADGLPLATAGDTYACDEVAVRMARV